MLSRRLFELAHQLWSSPVFGDAFQTLPPDAAAQLPTQIKALYPEVLSALRAVIGPALATPDETELTAILSQVAPKATAFCAAAAADCAADSSAVRGVVVVMALIYWADQSMDRGDEAMVQAVRALGANGAHDTSPTRPGSAVGRRVRALCAIHDQIEQLSRPEDRSLLWRCAVSDTLQREAWMWALNREYRRRSPQDFWDERLTDVVATSGANLGFICATALLYAAYRQRDASLPPLSEVLGTQPIMDVLLGPGNAAIRAFDDIGDRQIDAGLHPDWGDRSINLLNEAEPRFIDAFLAHAGLHAGDDRRALHSAFLRGDHSVIVERFVGLVRAQFAAIPASLQERHATFLMLSKRIIEAGFVNLCGDIDLSEQRAARAQTVSQLVP